MKRNLVLVVLLAKRNLVPVALLAKRNLVLVVLLALLVGSLGCFRATYTQLYGNAGDAPVRYDGPPQRDVSPWKHFFFFGLLPTEQRVAAGEICGERGVREIQTQETFLQGLLKSLTSYYVNLYSPWNAQTRCN